MGVLTRDERDALTVSLARRWRLWQMHEVKETLSEAPRTFNRGYTDSYLLYDALTRDFGDAEEAATSREDLLIALQALVDRLQAHYATVLRDARARSEFDAMVEEMKQAVSGGAR